ncbi:MAG: Cache 3/Cache 2 fusion domain-containing protein [Candidatus Paracaedimonas acanthamoebae]|uniref:Cache 3/Cache 2 fusion domain-containing protein n=1 Tax=Candidatus Paracaedimonas acanthamoebae TaxID=244581 RepID=A0A8J7PIV1_9PROT|nr:Cache 3/Cache 2 fusion domain-containing protein [Candidatus Paracaedimonas acanthamoebae]
MLKINFSFKSRKLEIDIISSFFTLILVTSLFIIWYTYRNSTQSLLNLSQDLISEVSESVIEKTISPLATAKSLSELGSTLIKDEEDISINNQSLLNYIEHTLRIYPTISNYYIGSNKGRFLQIRRLSDKPTYRADPSRLLPAPAKFALRSIDLSLTHPLESWYYLDNDGKIIESENISKVLYDHRQRSWYSDVAQDREFRWSSIYVFNTNKKPGITAAMPVLGDDGRLFAVTAVDINISTFSKFLQELRIGKEGITFIINTDGQIIAHPDPLQTVEADGDEISMMSIQDIKDKHLNIAFQKYQQTKNNKFIFMHNNVEYIAYFKNFPKSFEHKWLIGIVVPTSDIIGPAIQTQKHILIISFIILILSVFFIAFLARRISQPIMQLSEQAKQIQNFEIFETEPLSSYIYEIQVLENSMAAMRQSLKTFAKFVPKALVKKLVQRSQDVRISGNIKRVTLFFSDIQGFTTVSENYPPEKLMSHISEYFATLSEIIIHQNGTIDKYIGDAIMAFWGAPLSDKHHALNACISALYCQKRLDELNRKWEAEKKPILITRIGIETGEALVGTIGSFDRLNYTALGDTVNLASRLEGTNKYYNTRIIIGEQTQREIRDNGVFRPLDRVSVKGKETSVTIYELVALKNGDPSLLPTKEQIDLCSQFTIGYRLYLERRWEEALKHFEEMIKIFGNDYPTQLYIERCQQYLKEPPAKNWDGIYHLKDK